MKKKVLMLGNHGFVIYNFRKELIKKLLSEGYEVYISLPKDDDKVPKMISWGCKFIETNVDRRGTNLITDLKLVLFYIKMFREIKPDVALTYTIKPNIYGGIACRLLKVPCLNNITGLGSGFSKGFILKSILTFLYRISLKKSACVFFQNEEDMKILVGKKIVKGIYKLIPGSGVNIEEFRYKEFPKEDPITFLYIGRIMKDKGIDQYLEAAKVIKEKYPNTKFNIVGFVEKTQSYYSELIRDYEEKGYVNYLGYQSDVKPYIEEAHCLIQASHGGEGLSNVLLEAGAMGRALIASNIPGCRETIKEGKNGFIFEAKNTVSLINKLEKFIGLNYQTKKQFGVNSYMRIKDKFDRKQVVEAYIKIIKSL